MGVVWGLALALAGMAVGAMLAAIFFRVRLHDVLEAAVSHGRESLQIDLATHVERLRALEAEALQGRQELLRLRQEADTLQRELEMAGHHRARLSERAARVPALEAQARRLTLQLRMTEEEMRRLAVSDRVVCASPAYLARHPAIDVPQDLVRHNCLTYRLNMGSVQWRFLDEGGSTIDVPVTGSLQTDFGPALRTAALAGLGLALMPDWSVQEDIRRGDLVRLFPQYKVSFLEFDNGIYAVYQRNRYMSAKVRLFVDHLVALFDAPQAA